VEDSVSELLPTEQEIDEKKALMEWAANDICSTIEKDTGTRPYWQWVSDTELKLFEPGAKPIMSFHLERLQ
jgi:hypothetical protein